MGMEFLRYTGIDLNQPWEKVLEELQMKNVSLLDRIGTCQDKEQLGKLQYVQQQVEALCEEIDRIVSTGVSLEPPKGSQAKPEEPTVPAPPAPAVTAAAKPAESASTVPVEPVPPAPEPAKVPAAPAESAPAKPQSEEPESEEQAAGERMKKVLARQQAAPRVEFRLGGGGKILEKYTGDGGDVVIPEGVEEVGPRAFSMESSVYSIRFPQSLKWIGDHAFSDCRNLRTMEIPRGGIGDWAFDSCANLQKVTIGPEVTEISERAFSRCPRLESVILRPGLTDIGENAFYKCTRLAEIVLPETVVRVGKSAFSSCERLKKVTLSPKMTVISPSLFHGCSSLERITIPKGVTHIGGSAFEGCTGLREITIPDGKTVIGDYAFSDCDRGRIRVYAPRGSYAQEIAGDWGMVFCPL